MSDWAIDFIARFSVVCALNYSKIMIATAVVTAVMAVVLLILRQQVLKEERWLNYLGFGFTVFSIQYGLRAFASWQRAGDYAKSEPRLIEGFAQSIFSSLNSLCFLAAALALLYWLPHGWWRTPWTRVLIWLFAANAVADVLLREPLGRRFDALIAASVLSILSWALYMNSGTRQRRRWALLNLAGGFSYSSLMLIYAFVPEIAQWTPLAFRINAFMSMSSASLTPQQALDSGVFALGFLFKVMLFVSALLVIIRCLSGFSPAVTRAILEPVKMGRGEYLAGGGIVRAMAESIGADVATLCFRLPGTIRDEVIAVTWEDHGLSGTHNEVTLPRPLPERSTIGRTLVSDDIVSSRDWRNDRRFNEGGYADVIVGIRSFLNTPLIYHGAVVGCLNFEWIKPGAFTATDVQRVRQIADYITPVIQTERWLHAIAELRKRLQFYNLDPRQHSEGRFIGNVGAEIHDVLAPMGTLLLFDFGFSAQWSLCVGDVRISSDVASEHKSCLEIEEHFMSSFGPDTTFVEIPLALVGVSVGKIILATFRNHDELTRPSLTTDRKQLLAISVLVKDTLLDLHRSRFGGILHNLHIGLDAGGFASELHWLRVLRGAAEDAGLGALTVYPDKTSKLHDNREASNGLDVEQILDKGPTLVCDRRIFRSIDAAGAPRSILELHLPLCNETLYLEVRRAAFGEELAPELPWKVFLDRLSDDADSALARIRAVELESEAMQFEMNALLVHELRNPAEEFQQAVEWLDENLFESLDLKPDDSRQVMVDELKRSAWKFMELANAVVKPPSPDSRSAVPLMEVRDRVDGLYGGRLAGRGIELSWEIDAGWVVGVPLHLAYIVLVSLVQNAREAIGDAPGRIHVHGEATTGAVHLHIDDTGMGIPEENRVNIFKFGFTTKKRGSGRGLALAQRALHRYKGDVQLADETPAGVSTRFTIRFPRS